MRRNLNQLSNGRRVLDTPRTGVLGSQVPGSGDDGGSIIAAEVTQYGLLPYEVRFKVESTNLPAGSWYAWSDGQLQTATLPDGRYTLNYSLYVQGVKQPGLGSIYFNVGTFPVTILRHPAASGVVAGQNTTITVDAIGSGPLSYQWQKQPALGGGYVNIPGATSVSYTTPATTVTGGSANDGDSYRVVITNSLGSVTSNPSTLEVGPARALPTLGYGMSTAGGLTLGYGGVPTAEFIGVPLQGVTPLAVTFTNQSTGIYSSLLWEFGDGQTSSSPNPTHVYSTVRDYTVTLTLTWSGGTVAKIRTNYVTVLNAGATSLTLNAPTNGTVNMAAAGNVQNTGTLPQNWTLSCTPAATLNPSSGTTAPGSSTNFTLTSDTVGSYTVTLTNTSGGSVVGNSDVVVISEVTATPEIANPRNASELLFQPLDTKLRTVTLTSPHPYPGTYTYNLDADPNYSAFGPTWTEVSKFNNWLWTNPGGDWLDSTLTPQGTSHWHVSASGNSGTPGNNVWYATPVTAVVQHVQTNNHWMALIVLAGVNGGGPRTIAGRHTNTPPRIEVVYTDTTTETLVCRTSALLPAPPSQLPNTFGDASGNLAISTSRVVLEFTRPSKPVASATLHYFVVQHFGGNPGLAFSVVNPPTSTTIGAPGVAATAGLWDLNLESTPGILGIQRFVDSAQESDFISNLSPGAYNHEWSPEFWGGAVNTAKLPYSSYHATTGKPLWVNAKGQGQYGDIAFVKSDYVGEGFEPLRPGLGAIKLTIPGNPAVEAADGFQGNPYGSTGSIARLFGIPVARMGLLRHIRLRWYVRLHLPRPLTLTDRRLYFEGGSSSSFSVLSGKWGFVPTHDCTQGGVSRSSGTGWGWQMRLGWKLALPATAGPDYGKWCPAMHIKADYDFKAVEGYNYAQNGYSEVFGKIGGYGGALNFDEWVLVETDIKQNTVTSGGLGYIPDGHVKVWVNNHLVLNDSDMAFVSLPLNPGVGPAVITAGGSNVGNGTCVSNATISGGTDQSYQCFPETLTLTFTSPTQYTIVGSFRGGYGSGTVGTMYATTRHRFTVTAGVTPFQAGDTFTITYPPRYTDLPNAGLTTPMRELGVRELWLNHFHGGRNEMGLDTTWFYTGLAWADGEVVSHIGPMVLD